MNYSKVSCVIKFRNFTVNQLNINEQHHRKINNVALSRVKTEFSRLKEYFVCFPKMKKIVSTNNLVFRGK